MQTRLPIDDALPDLLEALNSFGRAVLQAPPGAGKTTRVPLAILASGLVAGRIVMLEPRRLAVRSAADQMARSLGEQAGDTVGYRMRGATKVSPKTRIEVVTEGILTRMIQSDPELTGIGAVIFDEFHERSLHADLGLALCWEVRQALRPDLMLVVMSATLDTAPVARMLDMAPVITSIGQSFDVVLRWQDRPMPRDKRWEPYFADLVLHAVAQTTGGVLVFLPGEAEIRRVAAQLQGRLPADCTIRPLFGAMPFAEQVAAIAPVVKGRKIVLSTSIAETSLTIADIRVIVDAGWSRHARYDPSSGMSRLVTQKVTRAEATQRAGRAGRVADGVCFRFWTKGEDGALAAFAPAEIEQADLAALALELALWGNDDLNFLTPPPAPALTEARKLLRELGALDATNGITPHGRTLATVPLHPRLAHMLQVAGPQAAPLAALLAERDPLRGAETVSLTLRMAAIDRRNPSSDVHVATIERIRTEAPRLAKGLAKGLENRPILTLAAMAALAYPDRIGLRRKGDMPRYILSGGKGAVMAAFDPMAGTQMIVATDLDGDTTEAKIRQAVALTDTEFRALYGARITWQDKCFWSRRDGRVLARRQERFGALILDDQPWLDTPPSAFAIAMLDGVRTLGLRIEGAAARFRSRVELMRAGADTWPDMSDTTLLDQIGIWLLPYLGSVRTTDDWRKFDLLEPFRAMLTHDQSVQLDRAAPAHFVTPLDRRVPIDYDGSIPEISLRLQEMFGVTTHPMVGHMPLRITLLSPGGKPVQTTTDIPGFWANTYADVRRDMRGRYPRHPWPEDPTQAEPTLRAKPRGT